MRWGRILAGGFLAEVVLIVVAIPALAFGNQNILNWVAVIGSAVTSCGAAIWVARRVDSRFVVHGVLTGLTAAAIYIVLIVASGQTQPLIYWVAHGFKIVGGAAGGMFVARRTANADRRGSRRWLQIVDAASARMVPGKTPGGWRDRCGHVGLCSFAIE